MMLFMVIHILVVVDFIVVLQQSSTSWVFWVLAGMFLKLAVICMVTQCFSLYCPYIVCLAILLSLVSQLGDVLKTIKSKCTSCFV